jgi:hypothetical protein
MRTCDSSFPVAIAAALLFAATGAGGCAHAPSTAIDAAASRTTESNGAEWARQAPSARVVAINVREERRCRRETPLGSRVERTVCRTEAEERLRAEAAAERVRWGTTPTF